MENDPIENNSDIVLAYDIVCQFKDHIHKLQGNPIFQTILDRLIPIIGKFHAYGHQMKCLRNFHPLRVSGAGTLDFENTERINARIGKEIILFDLRSYFVHDAKHATRKTYRYDHRSYTTPQQIKASQIEEKSFEEIACL